MMELQIQTQHKYMVILRCYSDQVSFILRIIKRSEAMYLPLPLPPPAPPPWKKGRVLGRARQCITRRAGHGEGVVAENF